LRLPAELIVLSACESSPLAEGFLYAGAHRVLATLWPVNDAATSELMAYFYDALLTREGFTPAAALRQAQLSLARNPRWRHPYYWAGFALQGEW
jgi:CHAT domain-containing protein